MPLLLQPTKRMRLLARLVTPSARRGFSSQSFDGEISKLYSVLAEQHRHKDGPWNLMLDATKKALSDKEGPIKILDLASGPGEPGLTIAKELPHVDVILTDISPDQMEIAASKSKGLKNVSTKVVDACDLSEFESNSVDVVTSCYGYMFAEDKQKAFNETYRVLKTGGVVIATYWKILPLVDIARVVMKKIFEGGPPPTPSFDPLSLSEPGLTISYLEKAGFASDSMTDSVSTYPFDLGTDKDVAYKLGVLPLYGRIKELKEKGDDEIVRRGEAAFWNAVNDSHYFHCDDTGRTTVTGSLFEMVVAKKP